MGVKDRQQVVSAATRTNVKIGLFGDEHTESSAALVEFDERPVAFKVSSILQNDSPSNEESRPPPETKRFTTKEEAEAHKQLLLCQYRDQVVVCITPIYVSKATRNKRFRARQLTAARTGRCKKRRCASGTRRRL
jgi:hypothetical protein